MSSPGWYRDPDGRPSLRWWDGFAWADLTVDATPGWSSSEPEQAPTEPEQPPHGSRRPVLLGVGALAVIVVLLVVGALVGSSDDDTASVAVPATSTSAAAPSSTAQSSPSQEIPPGTTRIVDTAAGISYPYLGSEWHAYSSSDPQETTTVTGQYLVTQQNAAGAGDYIAQCTSGPLNPLFGYAGTSSLELTLQAVGYEARQKYYPLPNDQQDVKNAAVTIDGHQGWLYEFSLSWDVAGYDAKGEQVAMLLLDVGAAAPAFLYLSIPDTRSDAKDDIATVLAGVHVP